MTRDDIIRMGMEAGLYSGNPRTPGTENMIVRRLDRFAALAAEWGAKQEREACARVCEDEAAEFRSQKEGSRDAKYDWKEDAAMECSLAIRKRGEGGT